MENSGPVGSEPSTADGPAPAVVVPAREELHVRNIEMRGFRRGDGLFEIEGRIVDRKPRDTVPAVGGHAVAAGDPIHDMGVCIVFDGQMRIHDVRTFTDAAPYRQCPAGGLALRSLIGVRMAGGWNREVRERLGGERSCTHLKELLAPMATAAIQSLSGLGLRRGGDVDATGRPVKIDSCYAYGAGRELVRWRWPEYHRPQGPAEAE